MSLIDGIYWEQLYARDKKEKEVPECEYCRDEKPKPIKDDSRTSCEILLDGEAAYFDNSGGEYAHGLVYFNYCPMCGRSLK